MGLFGRRRLPAPARTALAKGERVIAWASTSDDSSSTVVVTNLGVWLPGRPERLGWHRVHKATWRDGRLTVVPSAEVGDGTGYTVMADDDAVQVRLADPDDVPAEIRSRVTRSVAYTAHHALGEGGVRVVARRVPGIDGVEWHVRYDEGTDLADPEVVAATEDLVAAAAEPVRPE